MFIKCKSAQPKRSSIFCLDIIESIEKSNTRYFLCGSENMVILWSLVNKSCKAPWLVWLSGLSAGLRNKSHQSDSQSEHMPGNQASSSGRSTQKAATP